MFEYHTGTENRKKGEQLPMSLLLFAVALIAASGIPGLMLSRRSVLGEQASVFALVLGAALGIVETVRGLADGGAQHLTRPWVLPGAEFQVGLDAVSAIFLLPIFLVSLLGSIYGLAYWKQAEHPENGRKLRLFYGLLTAGMALLVIARNAILFLYGWELMALSAYFLVMTEDERSEARAAGWIYLIATHTSTLLLFAMFALLRISTGSFEFAPLNAETASPGVVTAIFILALLAFGIKAGILPLHVWLPGAHAIAPSHVSALMSGVIIKMGIYGLIRVLGLLPTPPLWPGVLLLVLGVSSGILGVTFAIGQHDLKRLLAYHSIENIGIIVIGLGLAMIGRSVDEPSWVALGLAGAFLHTWNHALFKSLLFLSAGSVIHAVHTREIDALGGLAKSMPRTSFSFLIGAVAICGLPPLNGFISEFLIYLGLFHTLGLGAEKSFSGAALAAPALALIGALALACFVKAFGIVFLGSPRTKEAAAARESSALMTVPMMVLVGCCFVIGLAPNLVVPTLEQGIGAWLPAAFPDGVQLTQGAPLDWIGPLGRLIVIGLATAGGWLFLRMRQMGVQRVPTWGCGFAAPTARMQYTSSSLAQMLVRLFAAAIRPRTHYTPPKGLFPTAAAFSSEVDDVVLEKTVLPTARRLAGWSGWFRRFQQGNTQAYLSYILAILVVLYMWEFRVYRGWADWSWTP